MGIYIVRYPVRRGAPTTDAATRREKSSPPFVAEARRRILWAYWASAFQVETLSTLQPRSRSIGSFRVPSMWTAVPRLGISQSFRALPPCRYGDLEFIVFERVAVGVDEHFEILHW
jgi:hypothetical protein